MKEVCVIGTGMATALGFNARMAAASVRANLCRFKESYMVDKAGRPMLLSMAEFIDDQVRGLDRMLALAALAAREAIAPLTKKGFEQKVFFPIPVCLGLPAPRPGLPPSIHHEILSRLEAEIAIPFAKTERHVIPAGHASGLMALEQAGHWVRSGQTDLMLTGGVDSYYDPDTLEWLDANHRLHSSENKDGFIPGEGAGFCLVASLSLAKRYDFHSQAMIVSAASGEEPNPLISDGICTGEGLTKVLHRTLALLADANEVADWVMCDMNGESFRSTEWMYAYLRTGTRHRSPLEIWHPADCWGDIGAASGSALIAMAAQAFERGYARGKRSLIWCASDAGARAAVLLDSDRKV